MSTAIYRTEDPTLEVAFVRVDDDEAPTDSYAPLYRFVWAS